MCRLRRLVIIGRCHVRFSSIFRPHTHTKPVNNKVPLSCTRLAAAPMQNYAALSGQLHYNKYVSTVPAVITRKLHTFLSSGSPRPVRISRYIYEPGRCPLFLQRVRRARSFIQIVVRSHRINDMHSTTHHDITRCQIGRRIDWRFVLYMHIYRYDAIYTFTQSMSPVFPDVCVCVCELPVLRSVQA